MKQLGLYIIFSFLIFSCQISGKKKIILVNDAEELNEAIKEAKPGSEIVMSSGEWRDIQIKFFGNGTKNSPITLRAEEAGKVLISGESNLKIGGEYLVVEGLFFTKGASPSKSVIQFYINGDTLANHCKVAECAIMNFNKAQRNKPDLWVLFKGRYNELSHCYLSGKSNKGPSVRVDLEGNQSINNYHKIIGNYFGFRPPKGGPSAETIQIGNSYTSMCPSYTLVEGNLFNRCNGEVEIISSKSNFNQFKKNVFYKSEGSLVTRHGNYCQIDGNYFIGEESSNNIGGIRLIGTGHWVTNNYFYNLKGQIFRAPIAIMNGIPKSSINRYIQVTDVNIAFNTFVDCNSPWQFGVGSNVDQKDVLPASEIRSETPIRTVLANNIIYNSAGDSMPIIEHDSIDGISFHNNIIYNNGKSYNEIVGLDKVEIPMSKVNDYIWRPGGEIKSIEPYIDFEYELITTDINGSSRKNNNISGADNLNIPEIKSFDDFSEYGPSWLKIPDKRDKVKLWEVNNEIELTQAISNSKNGDIIELGPGSLEIANSIKIDKSLTIKSSSSDDLSRIVYIADSMNPLFELLPYSNLNIESIVITGNGNSVAFSPLKENMSSLYNLKVSNSTISDFKYILKAYKHSFAENIEINNSLFANCDFGFILSSEKDDKGDYNVENLKFANCKFNKIKNKVIDYYRGGYDESTIGGNLIVSSSSFQNCGNESFKGILIDTYGIINVEINGNSFLNNKVELIARLWGAKNNSESDNKIENSGKIITEQNLPLKLMY